jgi:hypothetical protein
MLDKEQIKWLDNMIPKRLLTLPEDTRISLHPDLRKNVSSEST